MALKFKLLAAFILLLFSMCRNEPINTAEQTCDEKERTFQDSLIKYEDGRHFSKKDIERIRQLKDSVAKYNPSESR